MKCVGDVDNVIKQNVWIFVNSNYLWRGYLHRFLRAEKKTHKKVPRLRLLRPGRGGARLLTADGATAWAVELETNLREVSQSHLLTKGLA